MATWFLLLVSVYTCSAATRLFRVQGLEETPGQFGERFLSAPGLGGPPFKTVPNLNDFKFFDINQNSVQVRKEKLSVKLQLQNITGILACKTNFVKLAGRSGIALREKGNVKGMRK